MPLPDVFNTLVSKYFRSSPDPSSFDDLARSYYPAVANMYMRRIGDPTFRPNDGTYLTGRVAIGSGALSDPSIMQNFTPVGSIVDHDGVIAAQYMDKGTDEYLYRTTGFAWQRALCQLSERFDIVGDLVKNVMDAMIIKKTDYSEDMERFKRGLIKAGLTSETYYRSIPIALEEYTFAPKADEMVEGLRSLGVLPMQASGSPTEVIEKIGMQIGIYDSEGSNFVFNKGMLKDVWSNVGYHKLVSSNVLLSSRGCSNEFVVYLTDNLEKEDRPIALESGINSLLLYVDRTKDWFKEELQRIWDGDKDRYELSTSFPGFERRIVVASKSFASDPTRMVAPTACWMHSRGITSLFDSPIGYIGLVDSAIRLREQREELSKPLIGRGFNGLVGTFVDTAKKLRRLPALEFFLDDAALGSIDHAIGELERLSASRDRDIGRQKKIVGEVFDSFDHSLMETRFAEPEVRELGRIVEKWKRVFPGKEWTNYAI